MELISKMSTTMTVNEICKMVSAEEILLGEEVLSYFNCEYDTVRQRNFARSKQWYANLANCMISYGFCGGNIILYKLDTKKYLVIDGRTRIRGWYNIKSNAVRISPNLLDIDITPWNHKCGCDSCEYFGDLPEWAKNNFYNAKIQVVTLTEKDTKPSEAREIFCMLNHGVQKVSRPEMYDNLYNGQMTQFIGQFTYHEFFERHNIFHENKLIGRKANDAACFLLYQEHSGKITGNHSIEDFYKGYVHMSEEDLQTMNDHVLKLTERLELVLDDKTETTVKSCGFLLVLSWVLWNIEERGINLKSKANKIKKLTNEFAKEICSYNATNDLDRTKIPRSKVERQSHWKSNGHDVDGRNIKIKRAKILRDEVLKSIFTEKEFSLLNVIS